MVRVGSSSSRSGGELYRVGSLQVHPKFSTSNMDNDIALLWLSKRITFSERVAPIPLIDEDEEIVDGGNVMVTGWGNLRVDIISVILKRNKLNMNVILN